MKNTFRAITQARMSRAFLLALAIGLLAFTTNSTLRADNKDTPDDVMRAGRNAGAELNSTLAALRDVQAITARMERDRAFATQILDAAKKKDKRGLADLLKGEAHSSQITIQDIRDFAIDVFVTVGGKTYRLCISSDGDCKHPSGQKSAVAFSEF